jgi:2-succinyl-5-enolpyruvyl-6-hydroxy-3-cyclohexene-1-carboxylate synthase
VTTIGAGDVSLACMQVVVDRFAAHGMRHACLSPGSRSTPIALALDRHPDIAVHVHLDERASAFFALGIARITASPVAVVCTSGTAAAELLPATVEAAMSHAPLLLLTADRPPEFRATGANQTIDQRAIYGHHAKASVEAALPTEGPNVAAYWTSLATDVLRLAAVPPAGPVHVDLPFPEPLTPSGAAANIGLPPGSDDAVAAGTTGSGSPDVADLANILRSVERGIVLAGGFDSGEAPQIATAADALGWPLLAEPLSQLRRRGTALSAGQALLGDPAFIDAHIPEIVLQFGRAPTTRSGQAIVASCERLVVIQSPGTPADPLRRADPAIVGDADAIASELAERGRAGPRPRDEWLGTWRKADAVARRAIDERLDRWEEPFEGRIARDLAATIPSPGTLFVGASMPVRDLDAFMHPRGRLRVLGNRGASGIDGVVSTALGVAAAAGPTHALIGDLSLLHDAGSLLWSGRRDLDLVVAVPNNDGGIIFSLLDQRTLPEHERLFTTPHGLSLEALSAAAGVGHERIERASELVPAIEAARAAGGVRIVEASIDRDLNLRRRSEIHDAVAAALASIR